MHIREAINLVENPVDATADEVIRNAMRKLGFKAGRIEY